MDTAWTEARLLRHVDTAQVGNISVLRTSLDDQVGGVDTHQVVIILYTRVSLTLGHCTGKSSSKYSRLSPGVTTAAAQQVTTLFSPSPVHLQLPSFHSRTHCGDNITLLLSSEGGLYYQVVTSGHTSVQSRGRRRVGGSSTVATGQATGHADLHMTCTSTSTNVNTLQPTWIPSTTYSFPKKI